MRRRRQQREVLPAGAWIRDLGLASGRIVRVELDSYKDVRTVRILDMTNEGEAAEVEALLAGDPFAGDAQVWQNPVKPEQRGGTHTSPWWG